MDQDGGGASREWRAAVANARGEEEWAPEIWIEDGVDRRFIQEAVGHRCDTSTAIYTHVSGDFMNTALRKALTPAFDLPDRLRKES